MTTGLHGQQVYTIEIYEDPEGNVPFQKWAKRLKDTKTRSRIYNRFISIRQGNLGDHEHLGGELLELKYHFGPGYRVHCSIRDGKVVLLLAGSDKGDQQKQIAKAREYLAEFKGRNEHESIGAIREDPR